MATSIKHPDRFSSSYGHDTTNSSSPTSAHEAFKVMLKDISNQLSTEDVKKLKFFCGDSLEDGDKKKPLDLLWDMLRRGKFSCNSLESLDKHLRHIDRCDLIDVYLEPFKEQYPPREVVSCPTSLMHEVHPQDHMSHPHYRQNEFTTDREVMSTSGVPATSLSSRHSYPSLPSQHYPRHHSVSSLKSYSGALSSYSIPEHAEGEVPAQSLMVGGVGHWVRDVKQQHHTSNGSPHSLPATHESLPPTQTAESGLATLPSPSHAPSQYKATPSQTAGSEYTCVHPSSPTHPPYLDTDVIQMKYQDSTDLSSINMPGVPSSTCSAHFPSQRSHATLDQFAHAWPPNEGGHTPTHSIESRSRLHEEDLIGSMESGFSIGSGLNALPYASPTTDLRNNTQSQASNHTQSQATNHTLSQATNLAHLHQPHNSRFSTHSPTTGLSGAAHFQDAGVTGATRRHSAAARHNPYPEALPSPLSPAASHGSLTMGGEEQEGKGAHWSTRRRGGVLSHSLPQVIHKAGVEGLNEEEGVLARTTSLPPAVLHGGKTYSGDHVVVLSSLDIVRHIGDKVGGVMYEFPVKVGVNCKCAKPKEVKMSLVPHKEQHMKYVSLEACLHIPKKCSRHKWLVCFSRSFLQVCTMVTQDGREVCTAAERTSILPLDTPGGDNLTHLTVAKVMPHECVLYKRASRYRLKVTADVLVEGYIEDRTVNDFDLVEQLQLCAEDAEECERFLEIKRRT